MSTYNMEEIISATEMVRKFSKILKNLSSGLVKKYAIIKNNKLKAVLLPIEEYERLSKLEELLEHMEHIEISEHIKQRMENYHPERNISWEKIKIEFPNEETKKAIKNVRKRKNLEDVTFEQLKEEAKKY